MDDQTDVQVVQGRAQRAWTLLRHCAGAQRNLSAGHEYDSTTAGKTSSGVTVWLNRKPSAWARPDALLYSLSSAPPLEGLVPP